MNQKIAFENFIKHDNTYYFVDFINNSLCMTNDWKTIFVDLSG